MGTHSIQATYGGDSFFAGSVSAVLSQVVNTSTIAPNLTWATPTAIAYPTPLSATQLNATATNSAGVASPGSYAYSPAAGTVLNPGVQTLSVTFTPTDIATYTTASTSVSLTVNAPPASVTLTAGPSTTPPGTQPTVPLHSPDHQSISGRLMTCGLHLDVRWVRYAIGRRSRSSVCKHGGRTLTLLVPANSTTVPPILLQSGTDAGAITVTLQLTAGGVSANPPGLQPVVIEVPNAVPVAKTVTVTRSAGQLTVAVQGFSNTRELTQATFEFTAAPGAPKVTTPEVTLPVGTIFADWFSSADSIQYGSTFTYSQIFEISGSAANIGSVQVTLTNSVGASTPQSAQ